MSDARAATRQVIRNSFHLLLMQGANYVLPLVTFPYLFRTVGSESYGQVLLANSIISFLITFADFGLNITSTEQVSVNRDDPFKLQAIVNKSFSLRLATVGFMLMCWALAILLIPKLHTDAWLYGLTFLMVPAQVLTPTFYFQGRDRMGTFAQLVILSKVIYTVAILLLVTSQAQYHWINPLNAISTILASFIGWWLVYKQQGSAWQARWLWPEFDFRKQSWYIMLGQLGQNAMGATYAVIAGFYLSPVIYGKFSMADRLIWPFHQLVGAGFQATFPQVTKLMDSSPVKAGAFISRLKLVFGLIGIGGVIGTLVFAPYVIAFLNKGVPDQDATMYLRYLSPLIFMAAFRVPFQQLLFAAHKKHFYTRTILIANVLSLILNIWAIMTWGVVGVIISTITVEAFILLSYWYGGRGLPVSDEKQPEE